jgi:hypothetical protein
MDYSKINISELAAQICKQFEDFKKKYTLSNVIIDSWKVRVVVASWIKDLKRHDDFHGSNKPDLCKQVAYMVYWLIKIKPISSRVSSPNSKYLAVNEYFALFYALNDLKISSGIMSGDFMKRFVYNLYYRDTTARQLFFTFELLYKFSLNRPI